MKEIEIALGPNVFETIRTGKSGGDFSWCGEADSIRFVELCQRRLRTGRWMVLEVIDEPGHWRLAWPPMAACYARNPAAARIELTS